MFNRFGNIFTFTTWGESHGDSIGCVIDGTPPNIALSTDDIQPYLDKRRPGQSQFVTQRQEADIVSIHSGVFEGLTTGTPISLIIKNQDQKSKDYSDIKDKFRPGHADYTYMQKYNIRDYKGGGRSSARETAMRVAAGAVARKILSDQISIKAALIQLGNQKINRDNWDWDEVNNNPFFCPDSDVVEKWQDYLMKIRKSGSSIGAIIEVVATGVPAGWGSPIYRKLDSDLASAIMNINAVKAVEIGAGMASCTLSGEENADEIILDENRQAKFLSNNSGGILGGISNGDPIILRFAIKPTSSILTKRKTIDTSGNETEIATKGRHDPCVGIRAVPVAEAMVASVLADHKLMHRAQCG